MHGENAETMSFYSRRWGDAWQTTGTLRGIERATPSLVHSWHILTSCHFLCRPDFWFHIPNNTYPFDTPWGDALSRWHSACSWDAASADWWYALLVETRILTAQENKHMPGMQPSPALPEPALPQHILVGSSPPHTYPQSLPGQLGAPAP